MAKQFTEWQKESNNGEIHKAVRITESQTESQSNGQTGVKKTIFIDFVLEFYTVEVKQHED